MKTPVRTKWSFYYVRTCLMGGFSYFLKPVLIGWLLVAVIGAQAATFYVSPTGNDANNGTTWALAKQTIQAGINAATSGDTILVADGTYGPITIPPGITVRSVNGVQTTIIDGGGVTRCAYLNSGAILDGFAVINGYARNGGGMEVVGGMVKNCMISGNAGYSESNGNGFGGGVYVWSGTLENCTINGNSAGCGGGAFLWGGMVENCTISGNTASYGGGVYVWSGTVLQNCTISGNTAIDGGGVKARGGRVDNCTIIGNTASYGGGVLGNGTVENCTIIGNNARIFGGGVNFRGGTVQDCTISGNTANLDGGGVLLWDGTVQNCTISENTADQNGGGVVLWGGMVKNCTISGNTSYGSAPTLAYDCGGGVYVLNGTVRNCTITENIAWWDGGGAFLWGGTLENCTISKNDARSFGGGVTIINGTVKNCLISGNRADDTGGGVYTEGGTVENCTIVANTVYSASGSYGVGGGMYVLAGTARNCIVYYNDGDDVMGPGPSYISYSCLGTNIPGIGNITNEPQFVSIGSGYGTNLVPGNYRLQSFSPCINAGTNQSWMMNAVDLDGLPRIFRSAVDMGAYEWAGIYLMRNPTIFSSQCGYGSNTIGQTIEVWNTGTGTMAYALSANVDWLSLSPASGTSTGETDLVSVNYESAGLAPGTYTAIVTITSAEAINSPEMVTVCLQVDKIDQIITFPAISAQTVTSHVGLAATASSGLPVSFAVVSGPGTITGGINLSFTAAGTVLVKASQADDAIYNPAPEVMNSFSVTKATAAVTLHNLNQIYNGTARSVTATTVPEGLTVDITYDGSSSAPTDVGRYAVRGVVNDTIYEGSANGTLTVAKADQTITSFTPTNGANFAATSTVGLAAQASSGLLVTNFAVLSGPGVISGLTNLTFTNSGPVSVTADQAGNNNWNPAPAVTNSVMVERVAQTITFPPIPAQVVTSQVGLTATASSGLPVSFAVVSGPGTITDGTNLTFTAAGSVQVVASQAGNTIYNPAPEVMNSFSVTKATAAVTLHNLNQAYNGLARSVTATTVPEGLTVDITYDGSSSAPTNAGRYAVAGVVNDTIYEGAANGTLTVAKADQTISSFTPTNGATFAATSTVGLAAQASSGLLVTNFAVLSGPGVISGLTNLTFTNSGPVSVTADQAGNNNWNPAPAVTNSVMVERIGQTITFPAIPAQTVTSQVGLAATASSGLPISFAVASGPGTIAGGTNLSFSATGIVWVAASQSGNSMWEAAASVTNAVSVMNPPAGEIRFAQTNMVVSEDVVNVELRVVRTNGNYGAVSVDYTNRGVTASAGLDYGIVTGQLTWANGEATEKIITIAVVDDALDESNEVFEVVLTNAVGTSIAGTNAVSATIVDNDGPGTVQFSSSSCSVNENAGIVVLTVSRTGGSSGVATVEYVTADSTASAGLDYTSQSGTLTWADGDASARTITVSILEDTLDEPDETFSVRLGNAAGAELGEPAETTVTIQDDDDPPSGTVRFAETNHVVIEGTTSVVVSVVRTGGSYGLVSVDYTNRPVTATAGADYGVVTGRLTWAGGDTSDKVITIPVVDDYADEPDELFEAVLTNAVGASISGSSVASVTIVNNDEPSEYRADIEVSEFKWVPKIMQKLEHPSVISFVLRNDGPVDMKPPDTAVEARFYLSGNMIFGDGDDIWVGTKQGDVTLAAGEQMTVGYSGQAYNTDVTIPEEISGDYYVFMSVVPVLPSGRIDPDGAYAMRDGPITIREPSDGDDDKKKNRAVVNDYDGDGLSDMMVYDEPSGEWAIQLSGSGEWARFILGGLGYETAPGDYDGDFKADPAVHQKTGSQWYLMLSGIEYQTIGFEFGDGNDTKEAVGDYNGDGLADPGLYEEANGRWSVLLPNTEHGNYETASVIFGGPGYAPVAGDYDGDGRTDPAVYAEETGKWRVMLSDKGYEVVEVVLGGPGCRAVVGDYDGDGRADPMVYHEATGEWIGLMSGNGYEVKTFQYGGPGYVPVEGDFDGDGKADPAIMSANDSPLTGSTLRQSSAQSYLPQPGS